MARVATLVFVVRKLERALAVYEQALGFERVEGPSDVPSLGARHALLRGENCMIELLEPRDERLPPGIFLRARGEGVFAVGVGVAAPGQVAERLKQAFIQVRGAIDESAGPPRGRMFVAPTDAHGVLLEVSATAAEPPAP
jgi:catechol 2,3-dioxygenase-like lactoylglutathione lyase family enzyme